MKMPKKPFVLALLAGAATTACTSDAANDYQSDYSRHEPLRVVGYPSRGSLEVVQKTVWRLKDGKAETLADLAVEDGKAADTTARNWIGAFGKAAAGKVTADFYDEGSTRQVVVLYFAATGQKKAIEVRIGGDDTWGVTLDETDPAEAAKAPDWAPATPGGTGSHSSGN
ncbi:hypothetical protein [Streptomyces sp. TLI_146]|uniref:hypothetical protein n=1 Tax=Streptomyces sp. TLI_146 TaxID=1938858 RepID=UPI000C703117|nr:hypothetical protein [Streptomyces sp. TLI_146]PKV83194.1 hypothetical protein BX283_0691 [Streptomyces sp. TLI_146]